MECSYLSGFLIYFGMLVLLFACITFGDFSAPKNATLLQFGFKIYVKGENPFIPGTYYPNIFGFLAYSIAAGILFFGLYKLDKEKYTKKESGEDQVIDAEKYNKLKMLKDLFESGILSEEEYNDKKKKLLG